MREDRWKAHHKTDDDGNPAGGRTRGTGIDIRWQKGPLRRGKARIEPNGAFVEDVIAATLERLEFYQGSKSACDENSFAIHYLEQALVALNARTAEREARGVEGTHAI